MFCVSPSARALLVKISLTGTLLVAIANNFSSIARAQTPPNNAANSDATAEEQKEKLAADKFLEVLIKKPAGGTALDRVFGYHVERGSIAGLIDQLKLTAERSSNFDEAGRLNFLVGLLQLQRGEDAQAVKALGSAQSLLKDNPLAAFHYGQALLLVGNTDGAATALESAIARKPARNDYLNIARELGRLYQRAGKAEDALRIWNDLEKNFPGDDSVRGRIASTLVEEGDLAGALTRYTAMAKAAKSENDRIAFSLDAARLRSQLGQKDEALKDFNTLLTKLRPGSYLYDEARRRIESIFLSSGDYAGLTKYYESWLQDHPDDLNVILRLARTLSLQGRSTEAVARFEQAIERAPNDEGARLACIDAYLAANRYADAATQFETLIKTNPKNPDYLVRYGQALMNDAKVPEAQRARAAADVWKRLSDAKPKDAAVQSQVADLLRGAKLTDEAITSYRAAIALAPDEPQHKEYLGEYLHQLKRTDEALAVWRSLADGSARNLDNLVRLAEVLHQFEQPAEALKVMADACQMKPKVTHRLRYVEWLNEAKEFDKAYEQLGLARQEADSTEDRARAFTMAVRTYKATGKLAEQIQQATAAAQATPSDGQLWRQLAVLYEANDNAAEALRAIEKAVEAEPNAIETLEVAARMTEASGRAAEAIDLRKRLVDLDRRFRSAHLQRLATLYTAAGQPDMAISTGKELLASAGGAIEAFKFYADLCGQLGRTDERLDTLRRCLRLNPRSIEAIELLATQLAEEFKTDQAIELVWKQLDLTEEIDKRRVIVGKLTDLYLRNNRLDQLISRLEFRGREANDRRTAIDLTATAYQQAGDLGLARDALETLLRESGRDTLLMERMVALAQQAGEVDRAIELQRELVRLSPGKQSEARLAALLIDVGNVEEAQTLWLSSVDIRNDVSPLTRAIDQMFATGEIKSAFDLTNKIVEANPSDWEMIARRMALAALADEWEIAEKDAQQLLTLNISESEESTSVKQQKAKAKNSKPGMPSALSMQMRYPSNYPIELQRVAAASQLVVMLNPRYSYRSNALPAPTDFGSAKALARFLMLKRAEDKGESDTILAKLKDTAMSDQAKAADIWSWYQAESVIAQSRQTAHEDYSDPQQWNASWRMLEVEPDSAEILLAPHFSNRQRSANESGSRLKPLSPERLQWLKEQSQKALAASGSSGVANTGRYAPINWTATYAAELMIAGKKEEAEQILKEKKNWPNAKSAAGYEILSIIQQQGTDDELWVAIEQVIEFNRAKPQPVRQGGNIFENLVSVFTDPTRTTKKLSAGATDAAYRQRVMQLVDRMLAESVKQATRGSVIRLTGIGGPRQTYQIVGNRYQSIVVEFPPMGLGPDDETVRALYAVDKQLSEHTDAWIDHLTRPDDAIDAPARVSRFMSAAYVQYWHDKKSEARALLEQALKLAVEQAPTQESTLRLLLADLLLRQDRKQEALAMIEQLSVYDQNTMAVREFAAARLASALGDRARAEQAARRLIGVRLDTDAQIELARLMRSLNMNDLAADVVRRLRGRTGSSSTQLQTLLNYFLSQNEKEAAAQVAMDLLQRTAPTPRRTNSSMTMDQALRNQALQALSASGQLQGLIENTKKRLERAPNSQRLRAELVDMYRASGQVKELDALLNQNKNQKAESTAALEAEAKQLVQSNKWSEACDAYLKLLRRNPQLSSRDFYEVERPFSQSKRLGDLADLVIEVGVQKFESYRVSEICERLIRNEQNYDKARQLFIAMLEQRGAIRNIAQSLNNVSDSFRYLINDKAMLIKVSDAMIDASQAASNNSWSEAFSGYSTSNDGRKNNGLTTLVRFVVEKPEMAQALEKRLREEIAKKEQWLEGKIWLGLLLAGIKQYDEAKQLLEPLVTNPLQGGNEAYWLIGSFTDSHPPLNDLTEKFYEHAVEEFKNSGNEYYSEFQYTLPARISQFMLDKGDKARARQIVLNDLESRSKKPARQSFDEPDYQAYQAINETMSLMTFLSKVDGQVEALKLARKLDRSNFAKSARYSNTTQAAFDKQVKKIEDDLRQLGGLAMLESMIDADTKGPNAVDLGISIDDKPFTGSGLKSLWQEMCADVASKSELKESLTQLLDRLNKLQTSRPQDTSLRFALAILSSYVDSQEPLNAIVHAAPAAAASKPDDKPGSDKPGSDKADRSKPANASANTSPELLTQAQWQVIAYLRLIELQQAEQKSVDVATVETWLSQHARNWPIEYRLHLLSTLGKKQLAKQDKSTAAAIWTLCLNQTGVSQWLLVDLAIAAARENMPELSIASAKGVVKAVDQLPGSDSAKAAGSLGDLLGAKQRQSLSNMRTMSIDNDAKSPLAARLIELDDAWTNQSMDSKILIEPLSVLVGLGQKDVQPWPVKYVPTGLNEWKLESVFDRLAKRANSAGQSEELVKKIIGSNEAAAGSPEALAKDDATKAIMVALTWLRNDRGDKAVDFLKAIESAQLGSVHRTLVLQTLLAGLEDKACRRTVAQLGLGWAILNKPTERYAEVAPFDRLALEIVRKAIQNGMNKELRSSAIATYLELCRVDNDRYEGSSRSFRSVPQLEEIIKLYLTKGDNANALLYLGQRQAILSQGSDRDEDWLGSWLLENIQSKSNRLEAYQLLAEWTFQGDASLLNIAAFSRRARLPEWIPESIGGSYPNFAPIADKTVPLVTSFYSLALLAEEVQQSDALIARYEAARQQKRARASVGLAITLAALKRPVPEELLKELSDGLVAIRPVENVIQARVAAPLPELNLALILNSRREHADWARETVKEVERHGVPVNRAFLTPWLTHYSYQQGWSEQKSLQPADDLKHWSLGTMAPAKDYYEGKTPSIWLTDDQGQVVHLCGFGSDWMCWRYPLTGNFEFEFETEHSNRREIEFYAGGLRFAAYDTYVDITTEDSRDWLRVSTAIVKKNEWNKHSVTFDDKEMKYSINGKLIYNEPRLPGPVTVALRSLGTKLTVCRNVKFTGQPKLVPSMPLLSGDHLRGWSGTYYGANLPSSKFNTSPREGRQDLRTGSVSNDKANLRWTIENDELISGAGKGTGPENQSVIQYHRPMSAGDKVEYEFYYEPGKFEVHPSLGRTAYLVLPEGIQRHWMTEANTSWKTPAGNRFAIEGAQASALQAGQWNKAAIEIHSDRVLISINGQVALELPWKPDVNQACFGLFHVEGQSQVRVRNITLTGSWPTQMPENLFAR